MEFLGAGFVDGNTVGMYDCNRCDQTFCFYRGRWVNYHHARCPNLPQNISNTTLWLRRHGN
jgi:hypothetical protein